MSKFSENEDDPAVYESSGDEWNSANEKKGSNRRTSQRLSKKPRIQVVDPGSSTDEDSSDEDDTPRKRKSKNGVNKKPKVTPTKAKPVKEEKENENDSDFKASASDSNSNAPSETNSTKSESKTVLPISRGIHRKFIPKTIYSEDYATGSFVILKKDAQVGDPSKHPCIWRIDGKALLQKYEAFDEDGKVRHKNTSIYTGWSPMDKDLYAPVTVDVVHHNNQNLTVELHWEKLKEINVDSE